MNTQKEHYTSIMIHKELSDSDLYLDQLLENRNNWNQIFVQQYSHDLPTEYMLGTAKCPIYPCGYGYRIKNTFFGIWTLDIRYPPPMGIITPAIVAFKNKDRYVPINLYIPEMLWMRNIITPQEIHFPSKYLNRFGSDVCDVAKFIIPKIYKNHIKSYHSPY